MRCTIASRGWPLAVLIIIVAAPARAQAQGGAPAFTSSGPGGIELVARRGGSTAAETPTPTAARVLDSALRTWRSAHDVAAPVGAPGTFSLDDARSFVGIPRWAYDARGRAIALTFRPIPDPIRTVRVEVF